MAQPPLMDSTDALVEALTNDDTAVELKDARVIIPKLVEASLTGKELEDVRLDILKGVLAEGIQKL
jgi:hypothetical protein